MPGEKYNWLDALAAIKEVVDNTDLEPVEHLEKNDYYNDEGLFVAIIALISKY